MQVIGLCRFSYPAIGGFQVEHATAEDRTAYLYAPARLEERFALFESITLPALRAQTDADFSLVVLIGENLPETYQARLLDLAADIEQISVIARAPAQHRPLMKEIFLKSRHNRHEPCLQFRMDDDDAVSVDFIEELRAAADKAATLLKTESYVTLDFNSGFLAKADADGMQLHQTFQPYLTAAMGMYVAGGAKQSIMNFAHHKVHRHMPTLTFNTDAMFLRTHNGFNDARQKQKQKEPTFKTATTEQEAMLMARFNIDVAEVRRVFSALSS